MKKSDLLHEKFQDYDSQSVYSSGSMASTVNHSSPGSSRTGGGKIQKHRKRKKTTNSLPAEFSLSPMMNEALSIAAEQFGDNIR